MVIGGLCEEWCLFPDIAQIPTQPLHLSPTFRHLAIQCMSQVTEWWSGCRDMLAQS